MGYKYNDHRRIEFQRELEHLINKYSLEYESGTPDYVIAEYLNNCLENYNEVIRAKNHHEGKEIQRHTILKNKPKDNEFDNLYSGI